MSDDLISRKQAIELYCQRMCGSSQCDGCDSIHILENLPTAYDLDKVVEQLEERAEMWESRAEIYKDNRDSERRAKWKRLNVLTVT